MRKWNVRALLREPLLHFLLIGLALFFVYGRVSPGGGDTHRIVVSQSQIDDMVSQYQANFNRPPTRTELKGLVDRWVRDEILYREGLSLGLDKDDPVIKRRILQKFELIAEEAEQADPTDADLSVFSNPIRPSSCGPQWSASTSFSSIRPSTSPEAVDAVKAALAKGADPKRFGQPSMLPAMSNRARSLWWRGILAMISRSNLPPRPSGAGAVRWHPGLAFIWFGSAPAPRPSYLPFKPCAPPSPANGKVTGGPAPARTVTVKRGPTTISS